MMGALKEALVEAGIHPRDVALDLAIAKYLNSGGTIEGALARLHVAAARMPGMGQTGSASDDGHSMRAQTRQPVEDGEAKPHLSQDQLISASKSSTRDGNGLNSTATRQSGHANPVREPSKSQLSAAASVAKVLSVTVLDTFRIRDGRSIGDVKFGEIERLRSANAMEASVFRQIQRKFSFADHGAKLRDLMSADDLNAMKQRAAEVADAQ